MNEELLGLGQAHDFYPILYYVRPREIQESFARLLALVQGLVATLRYGLDPDAHRDVVTDPRLLLLEEGLLYTLHNLADSSHLVRAGVEDEAESDAHANFRALLDELAMRGLTAISTEDWAAAQAHAQFRAATDPYIEGYAANLGYEPVAVWGTYARWVRDSALVSRVEAESELRADQRLSDRVP